MFTPWRVRLLGGLSAERGQETITRFRSQKTAAIFAYLCLHSRTGRDHGREELAALFWPEEDLDAGRNNLRVALSFLRKVLEPAPALSNSVIMATRTHVRLRPESVVTDVAEFETALRDRQETLALSLYDAGSFLPGIYEEWALLERERLEALAEEARHRVQTISQGLPPSPLFPRPAARDTRSPNNLPVTLDRFFGRTEEIADLEMLLLNPAVRLVTLTGAGGMGKTRLAVEAARRLLVIEKAPVYGEARFAGGIWFIPLATVTSSEMGAAHLLTRMRQEMGLPAETRRDPLEQIQEALNHRSVLFILDNLEQVADTAFVALSLLLQQLPSATFLAASRVSLGIKGERIKTVTALPLPTQDAGPGGMVGNPATLLFADRARSVETDFCVTPANRSDVLSLLRLLEGVPLAIELAAAWANVLTPRQMREQLETKRNALPTRRAADREARHSSLSAAFQWSYELLSPTDRELLTELSVFRGGFSAAAVAAVCPSDSPPEATLSRLHQFSFLTSQPTPDGAALRFHLMEALRELAAAQREETRYSALIHRHAAFFLEQAEKAKRHQGTPEASTALDWLEAERDNLRAALEASQGFSGSGEIALRLAAAQQWLWTLRGPIMDGRRLLTAVLSRPDTQAPTSSRADALNALGSMAYFQADYPAARSCYEESLMLCRSLDQPTGKLVALSNLATVLMDSGEFDAAQPLFEEALLEVRAKGDPVREASILYNLGNLSHWRRNLAEASDLHESALAIRNERGDERGIALSRTALGILAMERGDFNRARDHFCHSLRLQQRLGDKWRTVDTLDNLARVEEGLSRFVESVYLRSASQALRQSQQTHLPSVRQEVWDQENAFLREKIGQEKFADTWEAGSLLSEEDTIVFALRMPSLSPLLPPSRVPDML